MFGVADEELVAFYESGLFFEELMKVVNALRSTERGKAVTIEVGGREVPLQEHLVSSKVLNNFGTDIVEHGPEIVEHLYQTRPDIGLGGLECLELRDEFKKYLLHTDDGELHETFFGALKDIKRIASRQPGFNLTKGRRDASRMRRNLDAVALNRDVALRLRSSGAYEELGWSVSTAREIEVDYNDIMDINLFEGIIPSRERKRRETYSLNSRMRSFASRSVDLLNRIGDSYRGREALGVVSTLGYSNR